MKAAIPKINALAVKLHDYQIGVINRLAGDRHLFSFEEDYIDNPQRPTLSLSFKGQTGGLVTTVRAVNLRLPPILLKLTAGRSLTDLSCPEGWCQTGT